MLLPLCSSLQTFKSPTFLTASHPAMPVSPWVSISRSHGQCQSPLTGCQGRMCPWPLWPGWSPLSIIALISLQWCASLIMQSPAPCSVWPLTDPGDRQPRADPHATSEAASVRPGTSAETHLESQDVVWGLVSGWLSWLSHAPAPSPSSSGGWWPPGQRMPVRSRWGGGQRGIDREHLHRYHQYSQRHSSSHHLHFYCVLRKQQVSAVFAKLWASLIVWVAGKENNQDLFWLTPRLSSHAWPRPSCIIITRSSGSWEKNILGGGAGLIRANVIMSTSRWVISVPGAVRQRTTTILRWRGDTGTCVLC